MMLLKKKTRGALDCTFKKKKKKKKKMSLVKNYTSVKNNLTLTILIIRNHPGAGLAGTKIAQELDAKGYVIKYCLMMIYLCKKCIDGKQDAFSDYFLDVVVDAAAYEHVPLVEEIYQRPFKKNWELKILLIWLLKLVLKHLFLFLQIRQLDQPMLLLNSRPFLDLVVDITCA